MAIPRESRTCAELTTCYGFKIKDRRLIVPVGRGEFKALQLNPHTARILSEPGVRVRSFTLTSESLSICVCKDVEPMKNVTGVVGIDRNLNNVTVGNSQEVTYYDMSKASRIGKTTTDVIRFLKRNDFRICTAVTHKYGRRRKNRVTQLLHALSKQVVETALKNNQGITLEDMRDI